MSLSPGQSRIFNKKNLQWYNCQSQANHNNQANISELNLTLFWLDMVRAIGWNQLENILTIYRQSDIRFEKLKSHGYLKSLRYITANVHIIACLCISRSNLLEILRDAKVGFRKFAINFPARMLPNHCYSSAHWHDIADEFCNTSRRERLCSEKSAHSEIFSTVKVKWEVSDAIQRLSACSAEG